VAVFLQVPRLADGSLPHFLATESYDRWPESDPQWGTDGVRNETNAHWVQGLAASGGLDSYWCAPPRLTTSHSCLAKLLLLLPPPPLLLLLLLLLPGH
jgi:hypothetical protein